MILKIKQKKSIILILPLLILLICFFTLYLKIDHYQLKLLGPKTHSDVETISLSLDKNSPQKTITNPFNSENYQPYYFSIENVSKNTTKAQVIVNNKDWYTIEGIVNSALKDLEKPTDKQKAIALWKYVKYSLEHSAPAIRINKASPLHSPVVAFNQFGYSWCWNHASNLALLANHAGLKARVAHIYKHAVTEIYYQDAWHMFDSDMGVYFIKEDNNIASIQEIFNQPEIVSQISQNQLKSPYSLKLFRQSYLKSDYEIHYRDAQQITPTLNPINNLYLLKPGQTIRFFYDWPNQRFWSNSNLSPQPTSSLTNGILISKPDFQLTQILSSSTTSTSLPYPILSFQLQSPLLCFFRKQIYISFDKKQWLPISRLSHTGTGTSIQYLLPTLPNSNPHYQYFLSMPTLFAPALILATQFQVASKSIPRLSQKENIIKVRNIFPQNQKIDVQFTFQTQ